MSPPKRDYPIESIQHDYADGMTIRGMAKKYKMGYHECIRIIDKVRYDPEFMRQRKEKRIAMTHNRRARM